MSSLTEITNVKRSISIQGVDVDVYGVSGLALAQLMARFPEVGKMMSGVEVNRDEMMKMAPDALAAFMAAGTGEPNNPAAETAAGMLSIGDQVELIDEILKRTFPRGIGPFVEKLQGLGLLGPAATTPSMPTSPVPSTNSSAPDTPTPTP